MTFLTNFDLISAAEKYGIPLVDVFSKNCPPPFLYRNCGYIVNLENSVDSKGNKLPGTHWTAFWIGNDRKPGQACYFDPFGIHPPIEIQKLLSPYVPYPINSTEIQSIESSICGYYCLYFIYYMDKYKTKIPNLTKRIQNFVDLFNENNPHKNREILQREFIKHFPKK